jgi:uncharacterized membrane protein
MSNVIEDLARRWLRRGAGSLAPPERRALENAIEGALVSRDAGKIYADARTFGDRVADRVARFGGSWSFILGSIVFLVFWTAGNSFLLRKESFDPYPYIFLNLLLSMVAALQAPIIMMSQNRQAERDRVDATNDYKVNLKAEIEIMALHEKLDELRHSQTIEIGKHIAEIAGRLKRIEAKLTCGEAG